MDDLWIDADGKKHVGHFEPITTKEELQKCFEKFRLESECFACDRMFILPVDRPVESISLVEYLVCPYCREFLGLTV